MPNPNKNPINEIFHISTNPYSFSHQLTLKTNKTKIPSKLITFQKLKSITNPTKAENKKNETKIQNFKIKDFNSNPVTVKGKASDAFPYQLKFVVTSRRFGINIFVRGDIISRNPNQKHCTQDEEEEEKETWT